MKSFRGFLNEGASEYSYAPDVLGEDPEQPGGSMLDGGAQNLDIGGDPLLDPDAGNREELEEHLTKVHGRWAIVSKTDGRPLRYWHGEGKPTDEWVKSNEKSIQYWKHQG